MSTETRECICGCGEFTPNRSDQVNATPACRTRRYERASVQRQQRRQKSVRRTPPQTRYALVERRGTTIEVLGFATAAGKRAVERAFGIVDRDDLAAVAAKHLPIG